LLQPSPSLSSRCAALTQYSSELPRAVPLISHQLRVRDPCASSSILPYTSTSDASKLLPLCSTILLHRPSLLLNQHHTLSFNTTLLHRSEASNPSLSTHALLQQYSAFQAHLTCQYSATRRCGRTAILNRHQFHCDNSEQP